jgi:transcriptional regulator with XRE-family HTH domain
VKLAKTRRKDEGLTQVQVAALAGVGKPSVIEFEKGARSLRISTAELILDELGLLALEE